LACYATFKILPKNFAKIRPNLVALLLAKNEGDEASKNQGCQTVVRFHTQNPNLGIFSEGIGMENVGMWYDHLNYSELLIFYGI
jgi:hypothetical protein